MKGEELVILNADNPEWLWVENKAGKQGYVPRIFVGRKCK
jgi:oxalate decarboxylase/phosphoglucose isomerase-like protein (cupin superfamily)